MTNDTTDGPTFGPDSTEHDLLLGIASELANLERDGVAVLIDLTAIQAFQLLALLQLALRHPDNGGATATIGRELIERIKHTIERGPALAEAIRRGDVRAPC